MKGKTLLLIAPKERGAMKDHAGGCTRGRTKKTREVEASEIWQAEWG